MSELRASASAFLASVTATDPRAARANIGLVGVPYDGAVTYRGGANQGPRAIRAASDSIEGYCPKLERDLAEFTLVDFGDFTIAEGLANGQALVTDLRRQLDALPQVPLLAVGGDHLVAYPFLTRALERHPTLQIFHIDAHTDLRPEWEGEPFNHATVLRRVVETMPPTSRLYEWGIRSGLREEFELVARDPRLERLPNTREAGFALVERLRHLGAPVYVTLDVDGIDPSEIPGTGTPEPGGLRFADVEDVLVALCGAAHVVGADLVEVAPKLDPSGITDVAGARLARTLLLLLAMSTRAHG